MSMYTSMLIRRREVLFCKVIQGSDGDKNYSCVLCVPRASSLCHGKYIFAVHVQLGTVTLYTCIYFQHCDRVIAQYYPELFNKGERAKGTFINALVITSGYVALTSETTVWRMTMYRSK